MAHMKKFGRPPAKNDSLGYGPLKKQKTQSPFSVFPDPPEPPHTPDDNYVVPGIAQLWGTPGVAQPIRIKLVRPQEPALVTVIRPKQLSHTPKVVPGWRRPPNNVSGPPLRAPINLQTASVVDNCLIRLENLFSPMHSALNQMWVVNQAMYKHSLQMAYTMGQENLGIPEQDPYATDDYTHPEAANSGGTGNVPVVMIDPPGTTERRVRLWSKQPGTKEEDGKDGTSSKKSDKSDK